jgi:hypothetical protein
VAKTIRVILSCASALLGLWLLVGAYGCGSDYRLGSGTTVSLNQLWGMVAQQTDSYAENAILVSLDVTLAAIPNQIASETSASTVEALHFVAWANGPTIMVDASWPATGQGEMSITTTQPRNDPQPMPVGYALSGVFSSFDYLGLPRLLSLLPEETARDPVRLHLVYPPPTGLYSSTTAVPLLLLNGRSVELLETVDAREPDANLAILQVFSGSVDRPTAILFVPTE